MQFLRTLFWVVFAVIAAVFSVRNWSPVTVRLFGGMEADAKLPVLIVGAFLVGFLPAYILYRVTHWQLKRRLEAAERTLADLRVPPTAATAVEPVTPVIPAETGLIIPPAAT